MGDPIIQRTFAGGELAPALHARADIIKYVTGLRTLRNFIVLRSGGVANRAGTRLVGECKTSSTSIQIIRYVSDVVGESILIEAGAFYFRFFKNGGAVTVSGVAAYNGGTAYVIGDIVSSGGVNYYSKAAQTGVAPPGASWYAMPAGGLLEIPSPFGNAGINYEQSGVTITLTSTIGGVQPHELIYGSLTRWAIQPVDTKPWSNGPTGQSATAGVVGTQTRRYRITAAATESYEESLPSAVATLLLCGEPTPNAPHLISWTILPGAVEYYVYEDPYGNGNYGFIGSAVGQTSFNDIGFTPDFAVTPPIPRVLFLADFPRVAAHYQQRRFFGNSPLTPDAVYGSRTGFYSNYNISSPLQDDDAITFRVAGNQHNPVRWLLGLKQLVLGTDSGVWTVQGPSGFPLSPANILADQFGYNGVSPLRPVVIGNSIIYVQARGRIIRDLRFDQQVEGLGGRDLTIFASHLFDNYTIDEIDYQETPHSITWVCRSDGTLLGLTYLRDQEIWGWHRHDTAATGLFQHVCVVPEAGEDAVYLVVRRTIGGVIHRFIERLERREIDSFVDDAFFVDCGLTYSGVPVSSVSGLAHLNGQVVSVLADGVVLFDANNPGTNPSVISQFTVTGGALTNLGVSASVIHVGLPIRAEFETLDMDVQGSDVRDRKKAIHGVSVLLDASMRTFLVGPTAAQLLLYNPNAYDAGLNLPFTGTVEMAVNAQFDVNGRMLIRQDQPLPLTILGIIPNVDLGG